MGEKEKKFLGFLGLLISLIVLIIIVLNTINVDGIKANLLGDKMMNYLYEKQYEKFYDNLSNDNLTTLDRFVEYQKNICEIFGDIKNYTYIKTYKNENSNGENDMTINYDVNFSKYPNETIKIILKFHYVNRKLYASDYRFLTESDDKELNHNISYINSRLNSTTKEVNDAKQMITDIVQAYDNRDYKYIYELLSCELKENRTESDFVNYLEKQNKKYGVISNIKFNGYEISKDKSEYKLNYYEDGEEKLFVTFWIMTKDKLYLSGINFTKNSW